MDLERHAVSGNVVTDVLRDGFSLSGWRFSIAPFWFPDVFLTGLFWMVTPNPITATLLAGFLQPVLLVAAFFVIREAVGLGRTFFLLAVSLTLAGLALGLFCIRQASQLARISTATVILYTAVCLLAGMSNLLFVTQMLLPFTSGIAQWCQRGTARRSTWSAPLAWTASIGFAPWQPITETS